ncbi:MAG: DUF3795 domain-containing protein [Desulfobacterales bacterium]|nr:DUF3795 domain-containing protein [Gammaproteobacteria bacterium]NNL41440.1 DUF3795 domain-containing protein [Desulfobacterales bacterium]
MNNKIFAPCGLYCGVCSVYIASLNNNQKLKDKLAVVYNVTSDQVTCKGCLSDEKFVFCGVCGIRTCAAEKNISGCHCCDEFPCKQINDFPDPVGKKVILRSIPDRKRLGDQKWAESEERRFTCPHCNSNLFRGTKRCRNCKELVNIY